MKKTIIVLCIVVAVYFLFAVPDSFKENETANSIDKMFSGQILDVAQKKYTVHAMGLGQEEKIMTVRIEKPQYNEQAKAYFRDILDSHGMKNYELEIIVDDLSY